MITNKLIEGDPLDPSSTDVIHQSEYLPVAQSPKGIAWRIMTGNTTHSLWMRVAYRYEIEEEIEG